MSHSLRQFFAYLLGGGEEGGKGDALCCGGVASLEQQQRQQQPRRRMQAELIVDNARLPTPEFERQLKAHRLKMMLFLTCGSPGFNGEVSSCHTRSTVSTASTHSTESSASCRWDSNPSSSKEKSVVDSLKRPERPGRHNSDNLQQHQAQQQRFGTMSKAMSERNLTNNSSSCSHSCNDNLLALSCTTPTPDNNNTTVTRKEEKKKQPPKNDRPRRPQRTISNDGCDNMNNSSDGNNYDSGRIRSSQPRQPNDKPRRPMRTSSIQNDDAATNNASRRLVGRNNRKDENDDLDTRANHPSMRSSSSQPQSQPTSCEASGADGDNNNNNNNEEQSLKVIFRNASHQRRTAATKAASESSSPSSPKLSVLQHKQSSSPRSSSPLSPPPFSKRTVDDILGESLEEIQQLAW